jgi:hypothetical protein
MSGRHSDVDTTPNAARRVPGSLHATLFRTLSLPLALHCGRPLASRCDCGRGSEFVQRRGGCLANGQLHPLSVLACKRAIIQ